MDYCFEQLLLTFEIVTLMNEDNFWDVTVIWYQHYRGLVTSLIMAD